MRSEWKLRLITATVVAVLATQASTLAVGAKHDADNLEYSRLRQELFTVEDWQSLQGRVEQFCRSHPNDYRRHLLLGALYERAGMLLMAGDEYRAAHEKFPQASEPAGALCRWLYLREDWQGLDRLCQAELQKHPEQMQLRLLRSIALSKLGKTRHSQEAMRETVSQAMGRLDPKLRSALDDLQSSRPEKARRQAERLVSEGSGGATPLVLLAVSLAAQGDISAATDNLARAFEQSPLDPHIARLYVHMLAEQGRTLEELRPLLSIIVSDTMRARRTDEHAVLLEHIIARMPVANVNDAIVFLLRRVRDPRMAAKLYFTVGDAYDRLNMLSAARTMYSKGVDIVRDDASAHMLLGQFLERRLHDPTAALTEYRLALSSLDKSDSTPLRVRVERLQSLVDNSGNDLAMHVKQSLLRASTMERRAPASLPMP